MPVMLAGDPERLQRHSTLRAYFDECSMNAAPEVTLRTPIRDDVQPDFHFLLRPKISDLYLNTFTSPSRVGSNRALATAFTVQLYVSDERTIHAD